MRFKGGASFHGCYLLNEQKFHIFKEWYIDGRKTLFFLYLHYHPKYHGCYSSCRNIYKKRQDQGENTHQDKHFSASLPYEGNLQIRQMQYSLQTILELE